LLISHNVHSGFLVRVQVSSAGTGSGRRQARQGRSADGEQGSVPICTYSTVAKATKCAARWRAALGGEMAEAGAGVPVVD
jgi:hypothetical protein